MKGLLLLLLSAAVGVVSAAQEARLELLDGSTLRGEILALQDGCYRIRTRHLGVVELATTDIRSLSFGTGAGPEAHSRQASAPLTGQINALQKGLMSDEKTMMMIMELADDPQIKAILSDPELMRAVSAGDIGALSSNPAITRLLANPRIRAIQQQSGISVGR